jgi:hypothetical protein
MKFDDFQLPASAYDATVCGEPVELVTISRVYVVFRLRKRPAADAQCPLVLFRYGSPVFQAAATINFTVRDTVTTPTVLDVTPSFYPQSTRTRVTVTGTNLLDAGRAVWIPAPQAAGVHTSAGASADDRECSDLKVVDSRSFTCLLPVFADGEFTAGRPVVFDVFRRNHAVAPALGGAASSVGAPAPMLSFEVLPLPVQMPEATAVVPATLGSGTEVTVNLSEPMGALLQYPWVPVLTSDSEGALPLSSVTVTSMTVPETAKSFVFTLRCYSCVPGVYRLALGDVASSARAVLLSTALTVNFVEPACGFDRASPAVVTTPAFADTTNPIPFTVPLQVALDGPRGVPSVYYHTISAAGAPVAVQMTFATLVPAPGRGRALLMFYPPAAGTDAALLPKAGTKVSLTVTFSTATGVTPLSACTLTDAFEVTAPVAPDVYVTEVKPRLYFIAAAPDANSTVTFIGAGLSQVTKVLVQWTAESGAALSEPCSGVKHLASGSNDGDAQGGVDAGTDSNTVLTCSFPNTAPPAGAVRFTLWRAADTDTPVAWAAATVAALPTVTLAPASVPAYSETTVTVTLSASLPTGTGVSLALHSADGTRVAAHPQWLNAAGATVVDTLFTTPGAAYATLTVAGAAVDDAPTKLDGGGLTVTAAEGTTETTLDAVLPSELHVGDLTAEASYTFRLVFSRFALIASRARWVAVGPHVSEVVTNTGGTLHVRVSLPRAAGVYAVAVLDDAEAVLVKKNAAITVTDADTAGITVWGDNDMIFVAPNKQPFIRCSFDGAPDDYELRSVEGLAIEKKLVHQRDGLQHFEITLKEPCGACTGKIITFRFDFKYPANGQTVTFHRSFQLAPEPPVLRVWPPAGLDFSQSPMQPLALIQQSGATQPWCQRVEIVVETVQPRYPITLVLTPLEDAPRRALPSLSIEQPAVDPFTGTYTACIGCTDCLKGYYGAGLSAAHRSAHSPAAGLTGVVRKVTPRTYVPGPGPDPKPPVDPETNDGGLGAGTIALIVIGNLVFLAGAAWVFYKCRQRLKERQAIREDAQLDVRGQTRYAAL